VGRLGSTVRPLRANGAARKKWIIFQEAIEYDNNNTNETSNVKNTVFNEKKMHMTHTLLKIE
jgi:hypothetical protein